MASERLNEDLQRLQLSEVTRTGRELGRGSYATVFEVMVHGTPCAAKEMHPILLSDKRKHDFLTECVHSSQLLHPNLVQFIGIHYSSPTADLPWLVMELMYISLTGLIENYEKKHIPVSFKLSILMDICQGLQFLHNKSIAHRDLSSNNVLLTKHLVSKIADLGMAKVMGADSQRHTLAPGTQVFMPPEALSDESFYGFPIDVFSLGCVAIHLVSMQWPTPRGIKQQDKVTGKMVMLTEQQRREKYFVNFGQLLVLKRLVERCLEDSPSDRPVVSEVTKGLRIIQSDPLLNESVDIIELYNSVVNYKEQLHCKQQELVERNKQSQEKEMESLHELEQVKSVLAEVDQKLINANSRLVAKDTQLAEAKSELDAKDSQLDKVNNQLATKDTQLATVKSQLAAKNAELAETKQHLQDQIAEMKRRETQKRDKPRRIIELPKKVELRKAAHPWVRHSKLDAELDNILDEEEKETRMLFRKFLGILNKLTPQKFETLANQALQLPIDTEERLKGCIDRLFSKALEEPNFSVAYVQLCRVLSKVSVEVGTGSEAKKKTFHSILLAKCQQEFEKDKESDDALNELRKKAEEAATPEEKKQLEEELEETEYQVRHKYLGNIKFIGELFKIKMLSEGIMHECIRRLLQHTSDEEALECFSKLMFTIGKDLDHKRGHHLIQQYMDRVDLIIKAGKISSRIKFFLQDVVELRNCNWVPRRENNNPKKIDQIHEEAKQEEAEKQRQLVVHAAGPPMGGRQMSKGSIDFGRKGGKDAGGKMGGDWQLGGDKDKKSIPNQQAPKMDSTKFINLATKVPTAGQFTLAPSNKMMSMRPGGGGGVEKSSRQESTKKPSRSSGSKRSDIQSSISTGSAATSGQMGGPRRSHSGPDKHRERQAALEPASNMSRPGSSSSKGPESNTVSVLKRPVPDTLSEEEVEKKASSLIAEFCQNIDYQQ
ncbi:eukaryotic translation initiation factor 4 gamma 3-like isoform X2 [Dysidea avara]|uniref:eukaryotic translation initiation factor 4 gamma 3-like isoform X2 n=1 Tax=Dysidea avara TaxID=196820 RepID=UPI0033312FBC